MLGIQLAETGLVPDLLLRQGIRRMLRARLRDVVPGQCEAALEANRALREALRRGPLALRPDLANTQHYEVPPAFFERVLGRRLKYSCALFDDGVRDLDTAEERMLALTCERAALRDGQRVLDLGCGWGSLSLWLAERYPTARILAVSNSKLQREFVQARARRQGLANLEVVTADVNTFAPGCRFDRVVSIEMFEHVRNQELLLQRIASWLEPDGSLFVHHFAHRSALYLYETDGVGDWMARHFFSGGIMPSDDQLLHLQRDLSVERQWRVSGHHYQQTAEAWLARQDAQRDALLAILGQVQGPREARRSFQRWRLFFLACSELFGYRGGNEWWVTHVRMARRGGSQ